VTVGAVLLAYAAFVGVAGPRLLGRARWPDRAPMLGIVAYLTAAWSVVAALGLAGLTLAVHATALSGGLSQLVGAFVRRLRAVYDTPGGAAAAGLGLAVAAAVLGLTAVTALSHLRATRRQAMRHSQAARLVGRFQPGTGAMLIDYPQPAAYCVAGPQPTVVLTTGALEALDPDQLDAVLAHERAHLEGHHHLLMALARIGRRVLPFIPLMRCADAQVARLVEMHADDAATRDRAPGPLVTALVIMATGGSPAPGLAAAATDAAARIHRLLTPAQPVSPARQLLLRAAVGILALTPLLLALTPAVIALALGRVPPA
jgi:Zn-dependent protease with chaperone function